MSTDDDIAFFTGLESSTEYLFQVAASTRAGMGPFSEVLHVTTQGIVDKDGGWDRLTLN